MGFPPIKADNPKNAEIMLFRAGLDYSLLAKTGKSRKSPKKPLQEAMPI